MNENIIRKLDSIAERHEELGLLLSQQEIISDQNKFRSLSQEYSHLEPIVKTFSAYRAVLGDIDTAKELQSDPEMANEELKESEKKKESLEKQLQILLLPIDPNDEKNIYLEVRAGTGGDEAAIFVGNLYGMYSRYAETQKWEVEIINSNAGDHGGYREIVCRFIGKGAYSKLKFESGAHRVQRVPDTESQGRIHTSACTVAVLPEIDEIEAVDLDMSKVRVDKFRASGAGGQHVNKTDSAIRLTHLPSNIVVECQDERSQHKNLARAKSLLAAKILDIEVQKQKSEQAESRRKQVGSGDRSDRIRTYNYPQGRVTDHRINLTLYKLEEIIGGDLSLIIEPLTSEHNTELLAAMSEQ